MRTETKLIKTKLGLINLAEHLGNVSQACRMMGYSRESFVSTRPTTYPALFLVEVAGLRCR